jgi:MHS family proline/betaine transporter-like MFS transporter
LSQQIGLTREQKEAVGLLSIGTFLEYFDLMLYVHMAILLNDLFFSTTDSFSASLLGAFAFCTTFIFRPLGALLIGWLGDKYGRKSTVMLSTAVMAVSCVWMALLPTYAQIGVYASISVTLCRILQGTSCMGEKIGADIYITELVRSPKVYSAVAIVSIFSQLGASAALFVANLSLSQGFNWRMAFWIGAVVAFVGIFSRTRLRETPDFADATRELHKVCSDLKIDKSKLKESVVYTEKIKKRSAISFFLIQLLNPILFYFIYLHGASILKNKFGYDAVEIISHNFVLACVDLLFIIITSYLVSFIHPLKILKVRYYIITPFLILCPFLLDNLSSGSELMWIQIFLMVFPPIEFPAGPVFYKSFPVFKRFTAVCFTYATARATMYVVTSFGIVYLIKYFGNYGLLFIFCPALIGYGFALSHFVNLEKKNEIDREQLIDSEEIENLV